MSTDTEARLRALIESWEQTADKADGVAPHSARALRGCSTDLRAALASPRQGSQPSDTPEWVHECVEACLHDCPDCGHEVDHAATFHAPRCPAVPPPLTEAPARSKRQNNADLWGDRNFAGVNNAPASPSSDSTEGESPGSSEPSTVIEQGPCADADCLLRDGHAGFHVVPPGHPKAKSHPLVYNCSWPDCDYAMWDATYGDVEDHWREHSEARAASAQAVAPELDEIVKIAAHALCHGKSCDGGHDGDSICPPHGEAALAFAAAYAEADREAGE